MTEKLNMAEVVQVLKELAAERPDYTYVAPEEADGACMYSCSDGTPSCIVGYVLFKLTPEFFAEVASREYQVIDGISFTNEESVGCLLENRVRTLRNPYENLVRPEIENSYVIDLLRSVQRKQDEEQTWGNAVARAIERMA
jgi:hypothetical protein